MTDIAGTDTVAGEDPLAQFGLQDATTAPGPQSDPQPQEDPAVPVDEGKEQGEDPLARFDLRDATRDPEEPSVGEKATAVVRGVATGAARGSPMVTGAVAGAAGGFALGAMTGPFAPIAVPVFGFIGAVAGGYAGMMAGEEAVDALEHVDVPFTDQPLVFRHLQDLDPKLWSYAAGGETLGYSVAPGGATITVAKTGVRVAIPTSKKFVARVGRFSGNLLNNILDFASKKPLKFAREEAIMATMSATAGGVAVAVAPEVKSLRFGAEVIAPIPTAIFRSTVRSLIPAVVNAIKRMSPAGRRSRAGELLQQRITDLGGDPATVVRQIRELADDPLFIESHPTLGQLTDNPAFIAMEATLREESRIFGTEAAKLADDATVALKLMMQALRGSGDPGDLLEAARLRNEYFDSLFTNRLNVAMAEAVEEAGKITLDTPKARGALSTIAEEIIGRAMKAGRAVERSLWGGIDQKVQLTTTSLLKRYADLRGAMLTDEAFPAIVEKQIQRWRSSTTIIRRAHNAGIDSVDELKALQQAARRSSDPGLKTEAQTIMDRLGFGWKDLREATRQLSSGELIKFRNRMLAKARDAAAKPGGADEARIFGAMAEATLDDLSRGFETAVQRGTLTPEVAGAWDFARSYSFRFNEVHTRTFAGAVEATANTGANRIPPELVLQRALASGDTLGDLRLKELREVVDFLPSEAAAGTPVAGVVVEQAQGDVQLMFEVQERLVRLVAARMIDPETGHVNTARVAAFIRDEEALLDRFPETRKLLENALESEQGAKELARIQAREIPMLAEREAFKEVLGVDSPADAVRGALAGPTPHTKLTQMASLARADGPKAVAGLRVAIWDDAIRQATDEAGEVLLLKLARAMTDPVSGRPGLPSLLDIMATERIMSKSEIEIAHQIAERARIINDALETAATGQKLLGGDVFDLPEMGIDALFRFIGVRGGAFIAGLGPGKASAGPSLMMAARGSEASRAVFGGIPQLKLTNVLAGALRGDPVPGGEPYSLAIALLETPQTPKRSIQLWRQIHGYIIAAGLIAATQDAPRRSMDTGRIAEAP